MRSKYCFRPEDLSSAVFWFDSVYPHATAEHTEDLFALYVMRVQKRKVGEPSGSSVLFLKKKDLPFYGRFFVFKNRQIFFVAPFGLFLPSLFGNETLTSFQKRVRRYFQNKYSYPNAVRRSANTSSCSLII